MVLHQRHMEERSELQQRIDAQLREKAKARAKNEAETADIDTDRPDGVSDSAYIEGTSETRFHPGWAAVAIVAALIVGAFIWYVVQ